MEKFARLSGALLFSIGLSNVSVWYVWDKNHTPVPGMIMLLIGAALYFCAEMEEL